MSADGISAQYEAFRQGLRDLGYIEGQNIAIEYRSGASASRLRDLASELSRLRVDVIVAQGAAASPAKMGGGSVPIVFGTSGDPVEGGFVASLARPGGNLTGVTFLAYELAGKNVCSCSRRFCPNCPRVALLANPSHPGEQREFSETHQAAQTLGIAVQYLQVKTSDGFDGAFEAISRERAGALLVFPDALTLAQPPAHTSALSPSGGCAATRQPSSIVSKYAGWRRSDPVVRGRWFYAWAHVVPFQITGTSRAS